MMNYDSLEEDRIFLLGSHVSQNIKIYDISELDFNLLK